MTMFTSPITGHFDTSVVVQLVAEFVGSARTVTQRATSVALIATGEPVPDTQAGEAMRVCAASVTHRSIRSFFMGLRVSPKAFSRHIGPSVLLKAVLLEAQDDFSPREARKR